MNNSKGGEISRKDSLVVRRLSPLSLLLGRTIPNEHDKTIHSEEVQNELDDTCDEPSFYRNRVLKHPSGTSNTGYRSVRLWFRRRWAKTRLLPLLHLLVTLLMFSKYAHDFFNPPVPSPTAGSIHEKILQLVAHQHSLTASLEDLKRSHSAAVRELDQSDELSNLAANLTQLAERLDELQQRTVLIGDKVQAQISTLDQNIHSISNTVSNFKIPATCTVTSTSSSSTPTKAAYGVNVANLLTGAAIVREQSSWPVYPSNGLILRTVSKIFPSMVADFVLLEREHIEPGSAWCSNDQQPRLTIQLGHPVHPRAVSYQHTAWRTLPPSNAPALFNLYGCESTACKNKTLMVENCRYFGDESSTQEQFCQVNDNVKDRVFSIVQFLFKKNQENKVKTCAYLVRVFGEIVNGANVAKPTAVTTTNTTYFSYFFGTTLF